MTLDDVLATAPVVLVVGPGGVGKTTLAAALGCRAAAVHERRVLVVTVDPARRLADALGVDMLVTEPVLVPVGPGDGRLWASMAEVGRSWDRLVDQLAPADDAAALLANPLYRGLTRRFIQAHDYIALDCLSDGGGGVGYDLIVVDTPPSTHAVDVLDAPEKMVEFFDSRLLRWLTAPYRSRLAQATARPFLAVAERLLGGQFLARIAEFFWLFSRLQPGFVARAAEVRSRLDDPATAYVLMTTSDRVSLDQADSLGAELTARGHGPSLIVHNRALPDLSGEEAELDRIDDRSLRDAVEALAGRDGAVEDRFGSDVARIAWQRGDLGSVTALLSLFSDEPAPEEQRR